MIEDLPRSIISLCTSGPRLVSDRVASWEWESYPRFTPRPRYRQGALVPWPPKLIEAKSARPMVPDQEKG